MSEKGKLMNSLLKKRKEFQNEISQLESKLQNMTVFEENIEGMKAVISMLKQWVSNLEKTIIEELKA